MDSLKLLRLSFYLFTWTVIIHITDNNPYPFLVLCGIASTLWIMHYLLNRNMACDSYFMVIIMVFLYFLVLFQFGVYVSQSVNGIERTVNILLDGLPSPKYSNNYLRTTNITILLY